MVMVLLVSGLRRYDLRTATATVWRQKEYPTTTYETRDSNDYNEELPHWRESRYRKSDNKDFSPKNLFQTGALRRTKSCTTSHRSSSPDKPSPGPSDEITDCAISESASIIIALAYEQAPISQEKDTASAASNVFDSQTPTSLGTNGSGYKGKDKSHRDYTAASGIYDYGGSYTQSSHSNRRRLPEEESDSNEPPENPGGGDGPPGPDLARLAVKSKEKKKEPRDEATWYRRFRYKWTCCHCGESRISILTEACTTCSRGRCASCGTEKVNTWLSRIKF